MGRLVRSGDDRSQPLRGANAAASETQKCLRPDPESGAHALFRDLSNDNRWGRSMSNTTKFTRALFLSLPIFSFPISCALAQQTVLPETVISATGLPTDSNEIGSSVTVITEEQIQRDQRRTVPDLLRTVPGLNVVQTGGPGGFTSVFIRGANSNQTKVLIDGIEVSDPTNPNRTFDFGNLTTVDIERVEVLRGPQGGLYGADAIGGVVSITTKKGSGPAKWSALVEGGSFGTFNQSLQVSGGTENTNYAFTASHFRAASTPVTPLNLLPPGQLRNNDFYDNWTYSGKVGFDLSDTFGLNFVGRYTDAALHFTQSDGFDPITNFSVLNPGQSSSRNHEFYGIGDAVWKLLEGRFNNHFGIAYTDISRHSLDPFAVFSPPYAAFNGDRTKYYWRADFAIAKSQTLLMGVEKQDETARTRNVNASLSSTGAYAELQSAFGDRFFMTSNVRSDDNEQFGAHTTWRIAPAILILETQTKLKASYGTGFHAPSLSELYAPFFGNPNLLPEESRGYDFGFEQSLVQKRLQFGVTWFHNHIKNLIDFDPVTFVNFNIDTAVTNGYEAFAVAQITNTFQIRADYTHTGITAVGPGGAGVQIRRRPREKTSVSAVWQATDKLSFSATALWVSGWIDVPRLGFLDERAPGYKTVNLAVNYAVNDNLVVFGRIDNLLNQHYENPLGFEHTGLGVFGGVRVTR
jgi:vitamin B12 transporter